MYVPSPIPWVDGETLGEHLESRGVSRLLFTGFVRAAMVWFAAPGSVLW
jgi:hypothetical protein